MSTTHHIDEINQLIITDWKGDSDVDKFIHYYTRYMEMIGGKPEYSGYDEIVNFRDIKELNINYQGLKKIAKISSSNDRPRSTRMAMIVNQGMAYVLANGYVVIRKLMPGSNKEVKVFIDYFDALKWIKSGK